MKSYEIDADEYINLYDYFQNCRNDFSGTPFCLENIFNNDELLCKTTKLDEDFRIFHGNKYLMYIHCFDKIEKQISYINYFDSNRKKIKRNIYDCRGFISSEVMLRDNAITSANFFRPDGRRVIEIIYNNENQQIVAYIELSYMDRTYIFHSESEFIAFFLDCITNNISGDKMHCMISDRNRIYAKSLLSMKNNVKKFVVIHSLHTKNSKNVTNSQLKISYIDVLNNISNFSGIVVGTEAQKKDIEARFGGKTPLLSIPPTYASAVDVSIPKRKNKIIAVARLAVEKRLHHIIKAFHTVRLTVRDAELHIFGFENNVHDGVKNMLLDMIKELSLEHSVFLRGYLHNINDEYASAKLLALSSTTEGFSLALFEALCHGVPCVAYDIKYGPADIIVDGVTGYLVKNGDIQGLAEKMLMILTDEDREEAFARNSLQHKKNFLEENIFSRWKAMLSV
jgi:poly(glycerol-phosphate) alpha-glucosyltransferase